MTTSIDRASLDKRSRTEILSPQALAFVGEPHERFGPRRARLLHQRRRRKGQRLDFLPEMRHAGGLPADVKEPFDAAHVACILRTE